MIKQFATAFLLLVFMSQTLSNLFVVADYFINTSSFAVNCVNKNKPQLNCNGKCQVMNQIRKQQNSKPVSAAAKEKEQQPLFLNEYFITEIISPFLRLKDHGMQYFFTMQQYLSSFFHPPSIA